MQSFLRRSLLALGLVVATGQAASAQISLQLVSSFAKTGPFGMAYDNASGNMWWSNSAGMAFEMTLAGVQTGNSVAMPGGWSALAYDNSNGFLVSKGIGQGNVNWFNKSTGAVTKTIAAPVAAGNLIDGLDVDQGELWYSPDVNAVYRYGIGASSFTAVGAQPVISGSNSGIERIQASSGDYLVTVNDGSNPRKLCVYKMDYSLLACQNFVNNRYEDLAFDGRYVWAADYYGNKIDKFDILDKNGGSIISAAPEPATLALFAPALIGIGLVRLRRKSGSA